MSTARIHSGLHSLKDSFAPHGGREGREKEERESRKKRENRKQRREGMQMRAGGGAGEQWGWSKGKTKAVHTIHCSGHPERQGGSLVLLTSLWENGVDPSAFPPPSRSITHFQISMLSLPCQTVSSLSQSVSGLLPHPMVKDMCPCACGKEEVTTVAPALLVVQLSSSRISDSVRL